MGVRKRIAYERLWIAGQIKHLLKLKEDRINKISAIKCVLGKE